MWHSTRGTIPSGMEWRYMIDTDFESNKLKIYLIRHGKTALGEAHKYCGSTDEPLSKNGVLEIKQKSYNINPQEVFASPMLRALMTAKLIFPDAGIIKVADLKETDFGDFEGKGYDELKDNEAYRSWIDSFAKKRDFLEEEENEEVEESPDENGVRLPESRKTFFERILKAFDKILVYSYDKQLNEIAIVAHGGTFMSLLSHYDGGDYYDYMTGCGDGFVISIEYKVKDKSVDEITSFSLDGKLFE